MTILRPADPGQLGMPFRLGLSQLGAPPAIGPPKVEGDVAADAEPDPEDPEQEA